LGALSENPETEPATGDAGTEQDLADPIRCMRPSATVVSDDPAVMAFADEHAADAASARETAVSLYYAVRDGFRYDPYGVEVSIAALRADRTLEAGRGWCVAKAILLAAACRARGVPARLGFADVRNHLSTQRMRDVMRTDLFYWHGYTAIHLDGRWLKATPAFNVELCEKFDLLPLEFDGREDSIYHPFDKAGNKHMEYVRYRGEFVDVPLDEMTATFREHYPYMFEDTDRLQAADFDADVDGETGAG
jgi:transglutaminase-like putative cysteine protease